jgi:hypothetical protein
MAGIHRIILDDLDGLTDAQIQGILNLLNQTVSVQRLPFSLVTDTPLALTFQGIQDIFSVLLLDDLGAVLEGVNIQITDNIVTLQAAENLTGSIRIAAKLETTVRAYSETVSLVADTPLAVTFQDANIIYSVLLLDDLGAILEGVNIQITDNIVTLQAAENLSITLKILSS